ncbi:uncharacterized protein B0T15DRAFT_538961 [Chaetomium strumarium]|uniref:NAD(P)-binding domain-containing protein n=1 Tax=Chaetomium strumarium TaxID=1170767 RepID=A0AAJ0GN51_9PEZI|nr:hypothetical protein B0T15DRAFT_538961 [Chaetomium strumarium]
MATKHLERVAIIGASGNIGRAFAEALLKTGKHTVTALKRKGSNSSVPTGVRVVEVDYDDDAALVSALQGQQFLVVTLGTRVPEDLHPRICAAAGKAGVGYIMPNKFGFPTPPTTATTATTTTAPPPPPPTTPAGQVARNAIQRIADVQNNGVSAYVTLNCGFWYEWSLAAGDPWFGFSIAARKATFFDDGRRTITVSTWAQCGRALAALLSLPESSSSSFSSSDSAPSLADFRNGHVNIASWRVSQRDMLDSLHRVLDTTDADWQIAYESTAQRVRDGVAELGRGDYRGFAKNLYATVFAPPSGKDDDDDAAAVVDVYDYARTQGTANELLGLPEEDLDAATRTAVEMVESGWNPLGV